MQQHTSFAKILRQLGLLDLEKKRKIESFVRDLPVALQYYPVLRGWQMIKAVMNAQQENERQQALIEKNYSDSTRGEESLQK